MGSLLAHDHGLRLHTEQDAVDVLSSGLPACVFCRMICIPHSST